MSELTLLSIILGYVGVHITYTLARVAALPSELSLKPLIATGLVVLFGLSYWQTTLDVLPLLASVRWLCLGVAAFLIISPYTLVFLLRQQRYALVHMLVPWLYWTPAGQQDIKRLLAQTALQQGNTQEALKLMEGLPHSSILLAQVYALEDKWSQILTLQLPMQGKEASIGFMARARAFIELGDTGKAKEEIAKMEAQLEHQPGPIPYRNVALTRARLYAATGNIESMKEELGQPLTNVPPFQIYEILAFAHEKSGNIPKALRLYGEAYAHAPVALKERFARKLTAYNQPLPQVQRRTFIPVATYGLMLSIAVAYGIQLWLERTIGSYIPYLVGGVILNPDKLFPNLTHLNLNEEWRLLSYAFVHGGFLHVAMNTWVLWDIGRLYEVRRHWGSVLAAFVVGSIMGAYITSIAQQNALLVLVGASAGVLGIGGAMLADAWQDKERRDPYFTRALLRWILLISIFSLVIPGVSFWGHTGGIIGGMLWGFIRQGLARSRRVDLFAGGLSLGVLIYVWIAMFTWFSMHPGLR